MAGPDARGFQVIFNDRPSVLADPGDVVVDADELTVEPGGVAGFVGETSRGGPAQNDGVAPDETSTWPTTPLQR